ncbi:MAG: HD domain-containing phosphohydrolase [Burkholderiales bacterium]
MGAVSEHIILAKLDAFEGHDNMRIFIEHAPAAFAMFDFDMHYLAASRRWIEDYGLDGLDIIGQSHYEIFPEITESWKQVHRRALLGEIVSARQDRFDRTDGTTQWLNWEVRPWYTAMKEIGGVVIFTEDITYLREAEHALQRKIQELEKLMDVVPAAVWIANDPECRVITGNAVANQIFEAFKDENVSPTTVPDARRIFAPSGRELRAEELPMQIAAATNREIRDVELKVEMPSGQSITILGNAVPLRDEKGSPIGSIAAFQDISKRKESETLVQESEKRYKSLFDNMLNGFAHCRMLFENGQPVDFVYLDVNKAFEEQTGLHNVAGRKVTELIPGIRELSPDLFEVYGRAAKGCGPEHFETYVEPLKDWYSVSVYSAEPDHFVAVFDVITEQKRNEERIADYVRQLETAMQGTLLAVSNMVEQRDPYTAGHQKRVGMIAEDIAREMGWNEEKCKELRMIGLVHDIGKISVPAEILSKPGRLLPMEYEFVKQHVQRGYEILKDVTFPLPIAEIIYQHHERMDGSGYPQKVKADQILPEARILMVADVVEAISSHRPYRPALGMDAAIKEITEKRGILYDAIVVDAFLKLVNEKGYRLPQ